MKIYIAGKISGLERKAVEEKFENAKKALSLKGYQVFVPTILPVLGEMFHEDYLHICYSIIDVCDAVFMLKDWQKSEGAKKELLYAYKNNKKILYEDERNNGKMCCINEADKLRQLGEMFPENAQKYRPFKNYDEFAEFYFKKYRNRTGLEPIDTGIDNPYIWVKDKECFNSFLIIGVQGGAVWIVDKWYSFEELLEKFSFIDGTECGVLE